MNPDNDPAASTDLMEHFPLENRRMLARRMQTRMDELGLEVTQVAEQSGLSESQIYGMLKAVKTNPTLRILHQVSRALNCEIEWLLGYVNNFADPSTRTIPLLGVAEGGAYRAMPSDPVQIDDLPPADAQFRNARRFAVFVNDDRLEALLPPVYRGQIALLIDFDEAGLTVESGRVYLIRRKNADGQVESAFWRAQAFRSHIEFAPMTRDAIRNQRESFTLRRELLHNNDELVIAGLLYGATHRYL